MNSEAKNFIFHYENDITTFFSLLNILVDQLPYIYNLIINYVSFTPLNQPSKLIPENA